MRFSHRSASAPCVPPRPAGKDRQQTALWLFFIARVLISNKTADEFTETGSGPKRGQLHNHKTFSARTQPCGKRLFCQLSPCLSQACLGKMMSFSVSKRHCKKCVFRTSMTSALSSSCEKRHFLSHLYIKTMILPRQARDKHRENSKKDAVFRTSCSL
jgi:hypothetical protein